MIERQPADAAVIDFILAAVHQTLLHHGQIGQQIGVRHHNGFRLDRGARRELQERGLFGVHVHRLPISPAGLQILGIQNLSQRLHTHHSRAQKLTDAAFGDQIACPDLRQHPTQTGEVLVELPQPERRIERRRNPAGKLHTQQGIEKFD